MAEEKVPFKCLSCGYKFKRVATSTSSKICPYCGKSNITPDSRNEASAILQEATSKRYDF